MATQFSELNANLKGLIGVSTQLLQVQKQALAAQQSRISEEKKQLTQMQKVGVALDRLRTAGIKATQVGVGVGAGLVNRGFQGTVEMNRFQNELTLLSRTLAGPFANALDKITNGVRQTRQNIEDAPASSVSAGAQVGAAVAGLLGLKTLIGVGTKIGAVSSGGAAARLGTMAGRLGLGGAIFAAASYGSDVLGVDNIKGGKRQYAGSSTEDLQARLKKAEASETFGDDVKEFFGRAGGGIFDAINFTQRQFTGKNYKRDDARSESTKLRDELKERGLEGGKPGVTQAGAGFQAFGTGMEKFAIALSEVDKTETERAAARAAQEATAASTAAATGILAEILNRIQNAQALNHGARP